MVSRLCTSRMKRRDECCAAKSAPHERSFFHDQASEHYDHAMTGLTLRSRHQSKDVCRDLASVALARLSMSSVLRY